MATYFQSFIVFPYMNLVIFGPIFMNTLNTKYSKKFTGCKERITVFKGHCQN